MERASEWMYEKFGSEESEGTFGVSPESSIVPWIYWCSLWVLFLNNPNLPIGLYGQLIYVIFLSGQSILWGS